LATVSAELIKLRIPGALMYRDLAVRVVSAASRLVGSKDGVLVPHSDFDDQVVSAFGEAFNNVAIHGFRGCEPGVIEIEIEVGDDFITVRLIDNGKSFDISSVPTPDLDALPESGMGLFIIRSFMSEVSYRAGSPNVLSLTKRLQAVHLMPPGSRPQVSG
jgi:serine/threonine-protein kinase RsbW